MIRFYKNFSDKNVLNKNIELLFTMSGNFNNDTDILRPTFTVNNSVEYAQCNYVWIEEFNRYYFVENVIARTGSLIEFVCAFDALMSWNAQIKQLDVKIVRNEEKGFTILEDSKVTFTSESNVSVYRFPIGFDSGRIGTENSVNYVVTMIGG